MVVFQTFKAKKKKTLNNLYLKKRCFNGLKIAPSLYHFSFEKMLSKWFHQIISKGENDCQIKEAETDLNAWLVSFNENRHRSSDLQTG